MGSRRANASSLNRVEWAGTNSKGRRWGNIWETMKKRKKTDKSSGKRRDGEKRQGKKRKGRRRCKMARQYLGVPATSVPVDCLFLIAGPGSAYDDLRENMTREEMFENLILKWPRTNRPN